jgi:hypothetical protein
LPWKRIKRVEMISSSGNDFDGREAVMHLNEGLSTPK